MANNMNMPPSSGRNPISVAMKAIGSCFRPPPPPPPYTQSIKAEAEAEEKFSSPDLNKSSSYSSSSSTVASSSSTSASGGGTIYGSGKRWSSGRKDNKFDGGRGQKQKQKQKQQQQMVEPGSMKLSMSDIQIATNNFSPTLKIGQGGFGTVYKATLHDGMLVAVKRAKKSVYDNHLGAEFRSEIQMLARIEHLNLVRFLGYLEYKDEKIVVVEYVPNGTLREHIDGVHGIQLDLAARLDIAIDVAHAVTYLHMYTDHPIIHRDIKSSNILLTENFRAKVADFGFARLGAGGETGVTHVSTQVKGTAGYLDPEYLRTYQLTEKSDVYSFGVLLVEIVSGRRPIEPKRELKERITPKWAMKKFIDGNAIQVLDPKLREISPATNLALEKILELSLQCLAPTKQGRPTMKRCAEILWSIRKDYRELSASDPLLHPSHQSEEDSATKIFFKAS